ncbi:MAG: hypothetical protein HYZ53_06805 [Planctomycetes bacterium]|nr:hypothetical protein [Planctomycetota bacterium]
MRGKRGIRVGALEEDDLGPLLRLAPGERLYRVAATPWLKVGASKPIVFRAVTKARGDGLLEVFHFSQREGERRIVAAHMVVPESAYPRVMASIHLTIARFYPGTDWKQREGRTIPPEAPIEGLYRERPRG